MKTIFVNKFSNGMVNDIYDGSVGQFSITKQFDILTYGNRLVPLRGMAADTTNTGIGNIIIDSVNGLMYGAGLDIPGNPTNGKLWQRSGYGGTDVWQSVPTNNQLSGAAGAVGYPFLIDWRLAGNTRTLHWASANLLLASDPLGNSGASTQALTFTTIGQGFVHPADNILYFPYQTASATFIGTITTDATPFNTHNFTQYSIAPQYRVYCLCSYGDYLAVPATTTNPSSVSSSRVFLFTRSSTVTSPDYSIPWGAGSLQVLNNLNGTLIGISAISGNGASGAIQDQASIEIKGYAGGEAFPIMTISANHLASASFPTATINPNVNFIYKNRLYFSVSINPNDGVSNSYNGLWSIGKNTAGHYVVTIERVATNDNSETGVLAAAIAGDFVSMVHTAAGTITSTINGQTSSTSYQATSVYESVVNPDMPAADKVNNKKLVAVAAYFAPLTTGQQVVMKCRVDSNDSAGWKTLFTKTATSPDSNKTIYESQITASMALIDGVNYEFRLESTGGAQITGFAYKYNPLVSNIS